MAHFLPPEHVRQVNKLEWPNMEKLPVSLIMPEKVTMNKKNFKAAWDEGKVV